MNQKIYDRNYFEYGLQKGISGYKNYHWLPDRTWREARAIINHLGLKPKSKVLDFGCARGYMVRALRDYNINAYGVDISQYALDNCDLAVWKYLDYRIQHQYYDAIIARNTLEHLTKGELKKTLLDFKRRTDLVFFTVPVCRKDKSKYIIPIAEKDITHQIRWTTSSWMDFCSKCGWHSVKCDYEVQGIHEGWESYKDGIGFFILRK